MDVRATPVTVWAGNTDPAAPLVVLFHGRGSNEREIAGLAGALPSEMAIVALRGPVEVGPGNFAWFANRGIGRPIAASLRATLDWFRTWLDTVAPPARPVILVGFSGGAAFAGGLVLDEPHRFAGAALLYGTIPFEAGLSVSADRLRGLPIFHAQASNDTVMPPDLMAGTWQYLTNISGAIVETHRSTGGHAITQEVLNSLVGWLDRGPAPANGESA